MCQNTSAGVGRLHQAALQYMGLPLWPAEGALQRVWRRLLRRSYASKVRQSSGWHRGTCTNAAQAGSHPTSWPPVMQLMSKMKQSGRRRMRTGASAAANAVLGPLLHAGRLVCCLCGLQLPVCCVPLQQQQVHRLHNTTILLNVSQNNGDVLSASNHAERAGTALIVLPSFRLGKFLLISCHSPTLQTLHEIA